MKDVIKMTKLELISAQDIVQTGTVAKNSDAVRNTVKPMKDDIGEAAFGNLRT